MNTGVKATLGRFFRGPLPRGLALFLGAFSLVNTLGSVRSNQFDATLWWLDLRSLPSWAASALVVLSAAVLLAFGIRVPRSNWRRRLTAVSVGALMTAATWNAIEFYVLLARGT